MSIMTLQQQLISSSFAAFDLGDWDFLPFESYIV